MKKIHRFCKFRHVIVFCIWATMLTWSCAAPKKEEKDPFLEKWRALAEETRRPSAPTAPKPAPTSPPIIEMRVPVEKPKPETKRPFPTRKISLKMNNVDVSVLLRALARAADQNIIVSENVAGKINVNISQAPWDKAFLSILRTHGLTYAWEGDIIRIITAAEMVQDLERQAREKELTVIEPLLTRIIGIKYSEAESLKKNLESFLTLNREGKPVGSILVDEHTNSLVIQAIRQDMENITPVIAMLDRPTPQILIEAHIVEANKDVARELGIQWGGVHRVSSGGTRFFATGADNGVIGTPLSEAVDPLAGLAADFPADAINAINPFTLGFVVSKAGKSILDLQLSALQSEGKLNILSSPSITTLDNQTASIESGEDVPFQTVEDGEVKIEFKKAVLSLKVTPHVIDENSLKMKINVHKDQLDFTQTVAGNPTILTKNAETNVLQFDGQTLVIGGLSQETTSRTETGTPGIKDIPGLGRLFKKDSRNHQFDDTLIFITPHILTDRTAQAMAPPAPDASPAE
ncbi:MAG: type IV pilus secretin PilQ [Desulfobacterales bacterium]|nr:MAG: type IV pilus secretin PilQ [Desulfobacterales bacterium]